MNEHEPLAHSNQVQYGTSHINPRDNVPCLQSWSPNSTLSDETESDADFRRWSRSTQTYPSDDLDSLPYDEDEGALIIQPTNQDEAGVIQPTNPGKGGVCDCCKCAIL